MEDKDFEKDFKEKTKLNGSEKTLLILSIFQAVFSIFCAIVEGDVKWVLVALPWCLLAINHYYEPKIRKTQNAIIENNHETIILLLDLLNKKEE